MERRIEKHVRRVLPPLVLVPGIKGSTLSDAHGNRLWLSNQQAFGLTTPDLRLPLRWINDVQETDGVIPDGILRSIAIVKIYAPFLDWAQASNRLFYPFPYDWRRDNLESKDNLLAFLERISQQHQGAKIQIVAHSMGGLITLLALNRSPHLFHSILFAGVPFGAALSLFEDLHAGTATGANREILSPRVMFTFAAPYFIFPISPAASMLQDERGNSIEMDWYSIAEWERLNLGIFANAGPEGVTEEQCAHLTTALRRGKSLRLQLTSRNDSSFQYPPIAVLAGNTRPSLTAVIRNGPHAVKGWDFQSAPKAAGDGRVILEDAMPPEGVPRVLYESSRQHAVLLNDTQQVAAILSDLFSA